MAPVFAVLVVILIWVLIFAVLVWAIDQVPAFAPFKPLIRAILAIIVVVLLLSLLFGAIPLPGHFRL